MADGLTITGLDQFVRAVERFPAAVEAKLRAVAEDTSKEMATRASEILLEKSNAVETAGLITVVEDAPNHAFIVESQSAGRDPKNNVLWLEHGTRHQAARPYMRPSLDEARAPYAHDIEKAAADVAIETFK